jgi:hypothetical protein
MVGILDPFFEDNPQEGEKLPLEAKKPVRRLLDCIRSPTLDSNAIIILTLHIETGGAALTITTPTIVSSMERFGLHICLCIRKHSKDEKVKPHEIRVPNRASTSRNGERKHDV